jgi:glycosyltransferase involved in cell wall biosynthesis
MVFLPGDAGDADEPPGRTLNAAAASTPGQDLVVIAGTVELPDGWEAGVRAAALADDTVAAATALADGSGEPLIDADHDPAAAIPGSPLHPRVLWPWPHCAWIRRPALELVGAFDESLSHPGAVLADFAARALAHGLSCAVADDVCVHRTGPGPGRWPDTDRRVLRERHPWIEAAEHEQAALDAGTLRRSLVAARTTHAPISVTVDVRALGPGIGGTQTYQTALVLALARSERLTVRALVAADAPVTVIDAFADAGVTVITYEQAVAGVSRTDIVHRPQQVFTPHDLRLLEMVGDRIVVSQLDLISYRNPTYHATIDDWRDYRRATRLALAIADQTVFLSEHGRDEAIAEELVEPERATVAGIGVDSDANREDPVRPEAIPEGRRFLLVLGADYTHKNRPFAMALVDELRTRHGWDGLLVLAGTHQPYGSSAVRENSLLQERPELATRVLDLGRVSEPAKQWLVAHAEAQILASDYEGFGLVPLESAAAGRPCIYAPCASLKEIIDPAAATIVPWDPAASADAAAELLRDTDARRRHLQLLSQALERSTWSGVVEQLVPCYEAAITSPYRGAAARPWAELQREQRLVELTELQDRVAYGQSLIDRRGGLLTRAQQRGLLRVATRPWLRRLLLAPFELIGVDERETRRAKSEGG